MSFKTTGVLAAILIVLGAFWYFYDYRGEKPREEKARLARRLFSFDREKVRRVCVAIQDTMVVCERRPDSAWAITSPVRTAADRWTVDQIVANVEEIDRAEVMSERSSPDLLADYGLRRPSLRVYLDGAGIDTLVAGDDTPTTGFTYVKLSGKPEILTVGAWQINRIRKSLHDLRDRTALPFEREAVGRIEITAPGGPVVLTRNGQAWGMERPVTDRADDDAVSRLLTTLSGSRVRSFRDEAPTDLARYGLAAPKVSVTLFEGKDMVRRTLIAGDTLGAWRYAKYEAGVPVFAVDTSLVNTVAAGAGAYRGKTFAEIDPALVTRVELVRPDSTILCERDTSAGWAVVRPFGRAVDPEHADGLLNAVKSLRTKAFSAETVDAPAKYGFDRPALTVRLSGRGGPLLTLTLGNQTGDRRYARVDRRPNVYEVEETDAKRLWLSLKEKK